MTNEEFSNEFDVLYNNITSNQAPGLDEYEKSVLLTRAQEELVKAFFDTRTNKIQEGFDSSRKRQYDFSSLIKTSKMSYLGLEDIEDGEFYNRIDSRSILFTPPGDLFLTINEILEDMDGKQYTIVPISYTEYSRNMVKPYAYPPKRQIWRLISDNSLNTNIGVYLNQTATTPNVFVFKNINTKPLDITVEFIENASYKVTDYPPVITDYGDKIDITLRPAKDQMVGYWSMYLQSDKALKAGALDACLAPLDASINGRWPSSVDSNISNFTITVAPASSTVYELIGKFRFYKNYNIRYVKTPEPIILIDLDDGLSIRGYNKESKCELPANMHPEILQRAVELAKASYNVQEGAAYAQASGISATDKGFIQSSSKE